MKYSLFKIYNILVKKWKHRICPNDIISFNEELELNSTSIIELVNINDYSHEEAIVIYIKDQDLNKPKIVLLQRIKMEMGRISCNFHNKYRLE